MKKAVIILTIAFLAICTISAQDRGARGGRNTRGAPEQVKIDGTLQLQNGQFAVASGNNMYYVPAIERYIGFIDGLKEGSAASFEGYVSGNFLRPSKMTVNGKTYDLAGGGSGGRNDFDNGKGFGPRGFGPGYCGGPGSGYCGGPGFGGNNRGGRGMGW